jgi:phosphatidate cytidylyltransferase
MARLNDQETRVRALSGAVFVVVVMAAIGWGPWSNAVLWAAVAVLGLREGWRAQPESGVKVALAVVPAAVAMGAWGWMTEPYDPWPVLAFVWMIWANDTGAYLVGKPLGKHKLWPRISPGKSWEGFIGGMAAAALVAGAVFGWEWSAMGALIGALSTAGDLTESAWKRRLGLKDSGQLMPGHGGALDRFDGFLFAAPAYWAFMCIFAVA